MKKIFDIAKDSEQSWGTLATAIDGNFEDTAKFLLADKIPCGDNLITQPAELSEGWSYENGIYTHTSGYDNALKIQYRQVSEIKHRQIRIMAI